MTVFSPTSCIMFVVSKLRHLLTLALGVAPLAVPVSLNQSLIFIAEDNF